METISQGPLQKSAYFCNKGLVFNGKISRFEGLRDKFCHFFDTVPAQFHLLH